MRIKQHLYYRLPPLEKEVHFTFNGKKIAARNGDTIASALYATGVRIFSRSFKYHRPRGLYDNFGLGAETLVTVDGTPNVRADKIWVRGGMVVITQNAWPSVNFDAMAINSFVVPLLGNGFYYKMFHKPKWAWPLFEKFIRKAAGLGKISAQSDEKRYEKRYLFPDVCVIGAGVAGMAAALAAANQGKRVLLLEECPYLGGHSIHSIWPVAGCLNSDLNGLAQYAAAEKMAEEIATHNNIEILCETSVFAVYEDNYVAAQSGRDFFKIRAKAVVFATGATDRHLVFDNNDKPGVMTGRGVERLIAMHGIKPGKRAVVVTNHDGGYHSAQMLHGAGVEIAAIVDARAPGNSSPMPADIAIPVVYQQTIHRAHGWRCVRGATIGDIAGKKSGQKFSCDLLVIAVGYKPQLNLIAAGRGKPVWDDERQILRLKDLPQGLYAAGEVNGTASFARIYQEGWQVGEAAAANKMAPSSQRDAVDTIAALPADIEAGGKNHFICPCMDVTRSEMSASLAEGYDQVETLKRYTSMGMGHCQGKTCHEVVARLAAQDKEQIVPTTMRPPFTPVSFGILAGRAHDLVPIARTSMHSRHVQEKARFLNAGLWKRPEYYTDPQQEVLHVRNHLGIIDISTLGKIEISGPDVLEFLHFLLPGKYTKLAVGRIRYSIMVGEDGIFYDDGTIAHSEQGKYYLTTTTGNQEAITSLFWWWIATKNFAVYLHDLSAVLAAVNIAGPTARKFLQELVDIDLRNEAFPYMSYRRANIAEIPVRMLRTGFTGELSYEIHFPTEYGESLWDYLLQKGQAYQLRPIGIESQRILRLEKGHLLPGVDTDALSDPYGAGVSFAIHNEKKDFVGKAFLQDFAAKAIRERLVSYRLNAGDPIPADGVAILHQGKIIGRVTSSRFSPTLGYGIGLAWVAEEFSQAGKQWQIRCADGRDVQATVLAHAAYDPQGERVKC